MSKSVLLRSSRRHILRLYILQPLQSLTPSKIYIDRHRSWMLVERVSLLVVHSRADTVHHSVYIIRTSPSSVMNIENRRKHCRSVRLMYILRRRRHEIRVLYRGRLWRWRWWWWQQSSSSLVFGRVVLQRLFFSRLPARSRPSTFSGINQRYAAPALARG